MNVQQQRLTELSSILGIPVKQSQAEALRLQTQTTDFWQDAEKAGQIFADLKVLDTTVQAWVEAWELAELGEDVTTLIQQLEQRALLSGSYDRHGAILSIHAGTGGLDAQDFASMLLRMYLRFVEMGATETTEDRILGVDRSDWSAQVVERSEGEEGGVKRVVIEIPSSTAFGLLKGEAGVHRLVRLSPYNAKNLRQTSFALVEVIPLITERAGDLFQEQDIRIDVFRAGGHGGQGVNTTDSAVRLTHQPSGIVVVVQNERSQHQNKALAYKILASKLKAKQLLEKQQETATLKGEYREGSWGNQIRSYVQQPYQMVKDHRTGVETAQVQEVLDGYIHQFISAYSTYTHE
jgi:peptide chain release factor 2